MVSIRWAAFLVCVTLAHAASAEPKRVLFFGNSFTFGHGSSQSVDETFADLAEAAGRQRPVVHAATSPGRDLRWHVAENTAAIERAASGDATWDAVVFQEHSTKLTRAYDGEPAYPESVAASATDAVALFERVASHSPGVRVVLYETFARGPEHAFYRGDEPVFRDPAAMQAEVLAGYERLAAAVDAAGGPGRAVIAPVGEAWRLADYDRLHFTDHWHAADRGTLLAALVIYAAVYDDPTLADIDLSLAVPAPLRGEPVDDLVAAAEAAIRDPSAANTTDPQPTGAR